MSARLDDGFSTTITLANLPSVKLYEKEVTAPGMSGGGPIDTTTMRNSAWRTQAPKHLKTLTAIQCTVAYAAQVYDDLISQINVNQQITVTFPDGGDLIFYGWLDEFTPNALVEGEQPTANVTIQPSLRNTSGTETAPDFQS